MTVIIVTVTSFIGRIHESVLLSTSVGIFELVKILKSHVNPRLRVGFVKSFKVVTPTNLEVIPFNNFLNQIVS